MRRRKQEPEQSVVQDEGLALIQDKSYDELFKQIEQATSRMPKGIVYGAELVDAKPGGNLHQFLAALNEEQDTKIVAVIPLANGRAQVITEGLVWE